MGEDQLHIVIKKSSNPKEILIGGKRRYNFKLFITSNLHLHFVCFFVSLFLSFYQNLFQEKNDNNLTFID